MFQCQFRIHSTELVNKRSHISQENMHINKGGFFKQGTVAKSDIAMKFYLSINF
jgi:hypothetical protein